LQLMLNQPMSSDMMKSMLGLFLVAISTPCSSLVPQSVDWLVPVCRYGPGEAPT
jgi:hypothetical protein